jgi:hypothetical protein
LSQLNPIHTISSYPSMIHFKYSSPTNVLVFPVVSFLLAYPKISYMHSFSPPFVLHALSISSSLTWSFWLYSEKNTNYETPNYAVFSTLPSFLSSSVQIFSTPCSQTPQSMLLP